MTNTQPPGVPGPVVPLPGKTTHEQIGDITGGPISPEEWNAAAPGLKRLMIQGWIVKACEAEGVDPGLWAPRLQLLVSRESGGYSGGISDPNIVNLYDENARAGIPSMGIAQVIQPNAPGQNLLDPVVNLRASIRHIEATYGKGDPAHAILNVQQADPSKGPLGYAKGGVVGLNKMQELNFRAWARNEGVQPTDDMRRMWMNPKGLDTGGVVDGDGHTYPHVLDPSQPGLTPDNFMTDQELVDNILSVYDSTDPGGPNAWARAAGMSWYDAAAQWIQRVMAEYGVTMDFDRAASIVAQLSQNSDWVNNMYNAAGHFSGRELGEGKQIGMPNDLAAAVKDVAGAEDPLTAGLKGQKIYNFLRAFLDVAEPGRFPGAVAVDRWAYRVAMGISDIEERWGDASKLMGRKAYTTPEGFRFTPAFDRIQKAYQTAARLRGITAKQMQAITWVLKGPVKTDATIEEFRRTGKWNLEVDRQFRLSNQQLVDMVLEEVKRKSQGFTWDIYGESPSEGLVYAPSRTTDTRFNLDTLTREDILDFIAPKNAKGERTKTRRSLLTSGKRMLGGWVDEESGKLVLDLSTVGEGPEAIRAAQRAKQEGMYDPAAGEKGEEIRIGKFEKDAQGNILLDSKGREIYTPLGTPEELWQQHRERFYSAKPPAPAKPLPKNLKPMRENELPHPRGAGPGSAMAPPKTSPLRTLGRGIGPVLQGLGDAATAYGLVGQAAQQGIQQELEKGHSFVQQGDVLGIPYGTAFQGPDVGSGDRKKGSTLAEHPMTPEEMAEAQRRVQQSLPASPPDTRDHGPQFAGKPDFTAPNGMHWEQNQNGTWSAYPGPRPLTLPPPGTPPKPKDWWGGKSGGLELSEEVIVKHPFGPPSSYRLKRTGPNTYESPDTIPLGPGDQIYLNGRRVK